MTIALSSLVYALVTCVLFYSLRTRFRGAVLAAASVIYICLFSPAAGRAALSMAVFAYIYGLLIAFFAEHKRQKAADIAAGLGIAGVAALLFVLKDAKLLSRAAGLSGSVLSQLVIPIGFSFYSFQIISYFADVASGKTRGDRNLFRTVLYLLWFPKFISGPIMDKEQFNRQYRGIAAIKCLDMDRWKEVFCYVGTGFFLKLVAADRLACYVDVLWKDIGGYGGFWLFIGAVFYSLLIYCDFAGYSYVAMGLSRIFGIDLPVNFRMPYMSANITEFWRRWHISLSGWLRDYLYIPLGGNRKGDRRKILNTIAVFLVCGCWHGAGLTFVLWGLLHGIYSCFDFLAAKKGWTKVRTGIPGRIVTFSAVSFAWIFFRAPSVGEAYRYIAGMFTQSWSGDAVSQGLYRMEPVPVQMVVLSVIILIVILADILAYRSGVDIPELLIRRKSAVRYSLLIVLVLTVIVFGKYGPGQANSLIYMQF